MTGERPAAMQTGSAGLSNSSRCIVALLAACALHARWLRAQLASWPNTAWIQHPSRTLLTRWTVTTRLCSLCLRPFSWTVYGFVLGKHKRTGTIRLISCFKSVELKCNVKKMRKVKQGNWAGAQLIGAGASLIPTDPRTRTRVRGVEMDLFCIIRSTTGWRWREWHKKFKRHQTNPCYCNECAACCAVRSAMTPAQAFASRFTAVFTVIASLERDINDLETSIHFCIFWT